MKEMGVMSITKMAVVAAMVMAMCGCERSSQRQDDQAWEQEYAVTRELLYDAAQYKKANRGETGPAEAVYFRHQSSLSYSDVNLERTRRLFDLSLCGWTLVDSGYFYGLGIGSDPTPEVNSCHGGNGINPITKASK